jgi:hypothetical protein
MRITTKQTIKIIEEWQDEADLAKDYDRYALLALDKMLLFRLWQKELNGY